MVIACLGWGSLVWDPRKLPVRGKWFTEGPFLPIEFARESDDGRITLVLVPDKVVLVRTLWAPMSVTEVGEAREALRLREGILKKNVTNDIGEWMRGGAAKGVVEEVSRWANTLGLDAVLWTNLPPKYRDEKRVPSADEVVAHLGSLRHEKRKNAERYIRMTPRQIDTDYRRRIEAELGWTPSSPI